MGFALVETLLQQGQNFMTIDLENIDISNNVYYKMNHEYFMELLELIKHGHCT